MSGGKATEMGKSLSAALDDLAALGLNWVSFVPAAAGPIPKGCSNEPGDGLLLLLSLGTTFAQQTNFADSPISNPFDVRAAELVRPFLREHFEQLAPASLLYPGPTALDLRAWMVEGRVEYPSLLGIGIRPDCGPWFAVRAAAWVRIEAAHRALVETRYPPLSGSGPCDTCKDKPCLSACPVDALRASEVRLNTCVDHRVQLGSECAERCHARCACPVGRRHRYPDEQMRYHYRYSLNAIVRWKHRG